MSLVFAVYEVLRPLGNELDPAEGTPDRLLQLAGTIDKDVTSRWVPELVELLWIDVAGVHHRDKLEPLPIHHGHQRRVVAQQLKIVAPCVCRRIDLARLHWRGWRVACGQSQRLLSRQQQATHHSIQFKRDWLAGVLHLTYDSLPVAGKVG